MLSYELKIRAKLARTNTPETSHGNPSRGLAPDATRAEGIFHRHRVARADHRIAGARARGFEPRFFRAGRAHGLAHAPLGPVAACGFGLRTRSVEGRTRERNPTRRHGVDRARR